MIYDERVEKVISNEFAKKAKAFYDNTKQAGFPIPYEEDEFITVMTAGYLMMKSGEKLLLKGLKETVKTYCKMTGMKKLSSKQITEVFNGFKLEQTDWTHFRWDYLKKALGEEFHDFIMTVENHENLMDMLYNRRFKSVHVEFVELILTIEYL